MSPREAAVCAPGATHVPTWRLFLSHSDAMLFIRLSCCCSEPQRVPFTFSFHVQKYRCCFSDYDSASATCSRVILLMSELNVAMRLISLSPASIHKRTTRIPSSAQHRAGMDRVQLISSDDETLLFYTVIWFVSPTLPHAGDSLGDWLICFYPHSSQTLKPINS